MTHRLSVYYLRLLLLSIVFLTPSVYSQSSNELPPEEVIARAITFMGGDAYLKVKTQVSRGRYSVIRDGTIVSFQRFHDVIAFPDSERTEFKAGKVATVQSNVGESGWIFDGNMDSLKDQNEEQIKNFSRGMRVSLDSLLRGNCKGKATLEYAGRRQATLGKRNDVLKLTYDDGLVVEFEIGADDGVPVKAIQRRNNADGEEVVEEDRYAQFIAVGAIKAPFIIDRFQNGNHLSRINVESVEYNSTVPDAYFTKPSNQKELKKSLKL